MLYDLFGVIVVVVVFGFLHKRRNGARRVLDDVRFEFIQFWESLDKKKIIIIKRLRYCKNNNHADKCINNNNNNTSTQIRNRARKYVAR